MITKIKPNIQEGFYIIGQSTGKGKPDRIYNIRYRKNDKQVEEKAGRQSQGMTPARASIIRAERMAGKRQTNAEQRQKEDVCRKAEEARWTVSRLWETYKANKPDLKSIVTDEN